jgi:hypothetical protein
MTISGLTASPLTQLLAKPPKPAAATDPTPSPASHRTALLVGGGIAAAVLGAGGIALALRAHDGRAFDSAVIGSVNGVDLLSNPCLTKDARDAKWLAPTDGSIYGIAPAPKVSIEHVDQGDLGDCWDVSGMGAIAHRQPAALEHMVEEVDDQHVIVHLAEKSVAITRELPMRDGTPAFAGSKQDDQVFWPSYIEKAQATQVRGGYRGLEGGNARDTFRQLLGADPVAGDTSGSTFEDALRLGADKPPMTMATRDPGELDAATTARMEELQVYDDHSYIVNDLLGSDPSSAKIDRFNPWGHKHPKQPLGREDIDRIFHAVDTPGEYVDS